MSHHGFTLIELMITIAIAAILLVVTIPNFQGLINENRVTTKTNELITDLMVAKTEAVRRGLRVAACIRNTAGNGCNAAGTWEDGWIVFVDANKNGTVDAGETITRVHEALPTGMTLTSTGFATASIVIYLPSGSVSSNGSFTLCKPSFYGRDISVSTTGRTSTTKTAAVCP